MKTRTARLLLCSGLLGCVAETPSTATDTDVESGGAAYTISPQLRCVWPHDDGTYEAVFDYTNHTDTNLRVEYGNKNRLLIIGPNGVDESDEQPSAFLAGNQRFAFSVRVPTPAFVLWRVGLRFAFASRDYERCASAPKTGKTLFEKATFQGNGRTCRTCHGEATGTLSPDDVAARAPNDPLFRWDGLDDFSTGTSRIRAHATVLVRIPLPSNVRLADDPTATSVVLRRGVPSTLNTPGLDPVLMVDGRAPHLEAQAADAVAGHAQAALTPTAVQLQRIAAFQRTERFFSSRRLEDHFFFGASLALPPGTTEAEKRGREFFVDQPLGPNLEGVCAVCHSGPMLNTTNAFFPAAVNPNVPAGLRFFDVGVSAVNIMGNPVHEYVFTLPDGTTQRRITPDPGRALITGRFEHINQFKTPSLWGSVETAPYFHDNSAKNLDEMLDQYQRYFGLFLGRTLTDQQREDIKAYLQLLR